MHVPVVAGVTSVPWGIARRRHWTKFDTQRPTAKLGTVVVNFAKSLFLAHVDPDRFAMDVRIETERTSGIVNFTHQDDGQ